MEKSRIELLLFPPYSLNLNLIERFWKCFKNNVLYSRYYQTFAERKRACQAFFDQLDKHADSLFVTLYADRKFRDYSELKTGIWYLLGIS